MTTTTLAVLVPLLPFLAAAAGLLLGRTAPASYAPSPYCRLSRRSPSP